MERNGKSWMLFVVCLVLSGGQGVAQNGVTHPRRGGGEVSSPSETVIVVAAIKSEYGFEVCAKVERGWP